MKQYLAVLLLVSIFAVEGCSKNSENENKSSGNESQNNESAFTNNSDSRGDIKAPEFVLKTVDGKDVRLSDYKGKIVVLDFWATWCPPCRKGIPDLIEIQKEFPKDVVVLGISLDTETKADVEPFIKRIGINYPIVYGNLEVTQLYGGVEAIPTSFVIDRNGIIVDRHVGLVAKSEYTEKIKKLL